MPKYRVTLKVSSIDVVEADNPFMAAVIAGQRYGGDVEVADVRPAVGRTPGTRQKVTKPAKTRRPLSPEARAKLAKNLEKARAARARKRSGAKKATKKRTSKR